MKDQNTGNELSLSDGLWDYKDCGRFLKRSVNTLRRDVMFKRIPFIRIGRSIRFSPEAIREYLAKNTIEAK